MEDLAALSSDELRAELRGVEADLEDLEEVRLATLGQTGVHLGAGKLAQLQRSWTRDEARLIERRAAIQELLQSRQS
jgi:hypothetical protein